MNTQLTPTARIDRALAEIRKGVAWLNRNGEKHAASERYQDFLISVIDRENVLRTVHEYTACVMESGVCYIEGEYACLACLPGITPPKVQPRLTPAEVLMGGRA